MQFALKDALARIQSHGKAAGILTGDKGLARRYLDLGATFVGVGQDIGPLPGGAAALATQFTGRDPAPSGGGYA